MLILRVMGFFSIAHMGERLWWYVAVAGWGGANGFFGPLTMAALSRFFGRVFEGGLLQIHRRISAPDALRWTERTRGMFSGHYADYAFGGLADRCFYVPWTAP